MIELLGPPRIARAGGPVALLLRPKALALLVRIALAGGPLSRQLLAEELFHDAEDPRGALRWHLAYLRRTLRETGAAIVSTPLEVGIEIATDVSRFTALLAAAQADPGGPEAAEAVATYRGDLCEGLRVAASATFDGWLYVEQEQLRRRFRGLVLDFARACLRVLKPELAIPSLSRLIESDPFGEDGHVLLIECYEALGDEAAASRAYARYSRIVREDLGAEPRPSVAARFGDHREGPSLPSEDLVTLPRLTLHFIDWSGSGWPILAIHGSGGAAYDLSALAEALAPAHRVIAADLRGHGFSDKPGGGYQLGDHVDDLRELLQELQVERPILLGYSIGGAVATALALEVQPRALVLLEGIVGSPAFIDGAAIVRERVATSLDLRFTGVEEYLAAWRAQPPKWSRHALGLAERSTRMDLTRLPDGSYRRRALRLALEELWRSAGEADSLGMLARVRCPVLLVRCTQDWIGGRPYFSQESVDAQRSAARDARVFVATRSDHATMSRDPEPAMIEAIRDFLSKL